jgi:hypothetical protein
MLMALLPPFGPNARWMATAGALKLARGARLRVERSTLTFLDAGGKALARLEDAFDLRRGASLDGPLYALRRDEQPRPPAATAMQWTLNDHVSPLATAFDSLPDAGELSLFCLPLHVPDPEDRQIYIHFVNMGGEPVNLVQAVREATLWVDGSAHPSQTGWHWDGRNSVQPRGWTRWGFRIADFAGALPLGRCELCVEAFGLRTRAQTVELTGEPWLPPAPPRPG